MLSFCEALKSILRSPWASFWAELTLFTALCCTLVLMGVGYRLDLNRAAATGLIMTAGITLFGKGWRVVAGVDEGVHGAEKEAQGLYSCTPWADEPVFWQTPDESNVPPFCVQISPKFPPRSAAVKTVLALDELGI